MNGDVKNMSYKYYVHEDNIATLSRTLRIPRCWQKCLTTPPLLIAHIPDQLVQVWSRAEKIARIMIFQNNLFSVHLFPPVVVSTVSRAEKKQK